MRLLDLLARDQIGRWEWSSQGADRLHGATHHNRFAVRDATGQTAGAIGAVHPTAVGGATLDHVVHFGAEDARLLETEAELHTLHALNACDRSGECGVESAVPVHVRSEPHREPLHDHFKDAADRIAGFAGLVDARDHALLCGRVWAAEWAHVGLVAGARAIRRIHRHTTNLGGKRPNLDAECVQERLGHATSGNACRRLARGGALQHVAHIVKAVLQRARKVGVPRANARHGDRTFRSLSRGSGKGRRLVGAEWGDLHHAGPVLPVAVLNQQHDGGAERFAMADAAANARAVLFNGLASTAAVTTLASAQINLESGFGEWHASGHPLNNHAELWSVRLACGQESKGHVSPLLLPVTRRCIERSAHHL